MRILSLALIALSAMARPAAAEPKQTVVQRVEFRGNTAFSAMLLRTVIANRDRSFAETVGFGERDGFPFDESDVRRDAIRIRRYYQRRGFPDVTVTSSVRQGRTPWQRILRFTIAEGNPVVVSEVVLQWSDPRQGSQIEAQRTFIRVRNRQPLQPGQRLESISVPETEGLFRNALQNLGYAFARVSVSTDTSRIRIDLHPGPLAYIDSIRVDGHRSVTAGLVRRESGLTRGDRFSQARLSQAQQELFNHHLFRFATVSVPPQEPDSTVNLVIRVREQPQRSVTAALGVGSEEFLRGNATWTHRNPFGNAHTVSLSTRASFLEQRVNADYLIPYVFNTKSSYLFSPFAQRVDEKGYVLYRGGASNSFLYRYNQRLAGSLTYELTRNEEFLKSATIAFTDSTLLYNQSSLQFTANYQQSPFERNEGWSVRPYAEHSGLFGLGTVAFQKASLDVRRYINPTDAIQLALRAESGFVFADDLDRLPANVRYYLGGTNSVRGYDRWQLGPKRRSENGLVPEGGRAMIAFNAEWRQDLSGVLNGFGLNLFLDGGQVWRHPRDTDIDDLAYAAGAGIRYSTPIGPIRLDLGYKLNPTRSDLNTAYLGRWGLHLSIGQAF
jgi:outer membrane protein insertion porin family